MSSTKQNFYKRGDVVLAYFPNSDQNNSKARPVLVVEADDLQTGIAQVVVVTITGQMRHAGHPSRVTVLKDSPEGSDAGVFYDSVVMTDSIATIEEDAIDRVIGSLPMLPVEAALRHTFGLS